VSLFVVGIFFVAFGGIRYSDQRKFNQQKPMKKSIFLIAILFLTGCGSQFQAYNSSEEGVLIEQLLPKNTTMVVSINTSDPGQREAFKEFSGGEDGEIFQQMGNVPAILGEDGFRLVMAYLDDGESFTAVTVTDIEAAEEWMQSEGTLLNLGDFDSYVTESDGQEHYMALLSDVVVVTSSSTALLNAKGQLKAEDSENLLANEQYMELVSKLSKPYVGHLYIDFSGDSAKEGMQGIWALGGRLMDSEIFSLTFEGDGLALNGFAMGDLDQDLGFSDVSGKGMYLSDFVPAEGLLFYEESGGIQGLFEMWFADVPNVEDTVTQYLGMDLSDEILPFLDKNYAIALHEGGVSFVVDVSSSADDADELIDRLDMQVNSLVTVMQYDAGGAESLSKDDEGDFHVLSADLEALGFFGSGGYFGEIPGMDFSDMKLIYGVTEDDLLVISTNEDWLSFDEDAGRLGGMASELAGYDQTVFYFDIEGLLDTFGVFLADFEPYLEKFSGAVFGTKAKKYELEMRGVVR